MLLTPRAGAALRDLRIRYFRNLERRMPAHVTMLFPFRSTADEPTIDAIGGIVAAAQPFDATFLDVGRFRDDVVWLRPEPQHLLDRLADLVISTFPDCSPYGGAYATRAMHLTVASRLRGTEADRLVEEAQSLLPITEPIDQLTLMVERDGVWHVARSWPLSGR